MDTLATTSWRYSLNMMEIPKESLNVIILSHMQYARVTKPTTSWTPSHTRTHAHTRTYTHTRIHARTHTHTHAHTHTRTHTRTQVADNKHASMTNVFFGRNVCRTTYMFTRVIGIKRYKRLSNDHEENSITPRLHVVQEGWNTARTMCQTKNMSNLSSTLLQNMLCQFLVDSW